ncbi:Stk1 family PASTA domain-containing Ser/Thr kinase [Solihabitans fulvus]|uniref:non-specific serine/threonine protein kinase n=1 Tax=Solihabitans fulvus TaxID=1892852 RepID=A0A5B2XIP6_9PSEU|nr:Stk1 family PASTA domain-containing Ser/Thr kinase [Solihabitans fulvus]KAA2263738.1 Stk1 family PASTA domain-containing Ser/Thr kinase [Solihabitans fulvus]
MSTPRLLSNRYEIGETLGYGGMSEVHRGKDVRLSRDVAVKVLRADLARDPQFQERFRREAQNAAALNHPAIVAVYDTGETQTEHGPLPYIVMEYVDGRTLRDIVKTQGPLSGKRAMEVMADVCAALDFSHRHGIVHRDVKPANVMITKTGAVKVMDFGIARAVADGQAAVTQTAAVIGTAQYLSPEQARGEAVDGRSDVYAAGCVLFELLTGEPPFTGDSPVAVAYQHVREDPKPPSTLNPNVTPALDAIVLKAMAKGPANRYQSAAEMRGDLVRVLSGQRPSAPSVMTAADRTSLMNQAGPTEVMGGGRHRPTTMADDDYDDEYDEEEERRARRKKTTTIVLVVVACLLLIGLAAWLVSTLLGGGSANKQDPNANKVNVPSVVGKTGPDASAAIGNASLIANLVNLKCQTDPAKPSDPAPCTQADIGKVMKTSPAAGTSVDKRSAVDIYVATAADAVPVPNLTGKTLAEAGQALTAVGLTLDPAQPQTEDVTDDTLIDKVSSQSPSASASVTKGTAVTVKIGKQTKIAVTDYTGQSYDSAQGGLTAVGLLPKKVEVDSDKPIGTVVDQNPKSGKLAKGGTVTLQVSRGPKLTMPNIKGMTVQDAKDMLANQGWTGSFTQGTKQTTDPNQNGLISDQGLPVGTPLTKDQAIPITVYQFNILPTTR